jgi:hypothetical protein
MAEHIVRGGSIWASKEKNNLRVRVEFRRRNFVLATYLNHREQVFWGGWEDDFREAFEWLAGK